MKSFFVTIKPNTQLGLVKINSYKLNSEDVFHL